MSDKQHDIATLAAQRQHWVDVLQASLLDPEAIVAQAHAEAKLAQIEEQLKELTAKGRGDGTA